MFVYWANCVRPMPVKSATYQELRQTDMVKVPENFAQTVKGVRRQLGLSQEEPAHELCVSFSTINRRENNKTLPFKLARRRFELFCGPMREEGKRA